MRYYRIEIDDGTVFTSFSQSTTPLSSLLPNGGNLPGALQIEMDIPIAAMHSPASAGAYVKIWGIPLALISQSKNFNGKNIKVFGGFKPGLPLATKAAPQAGLLVQGFIYQAYGNWQGNDMTLNFVILAGPGPGAGKPVDSPRNISLSWKKGTTLSDAIKAALTPAYSGYTVSPNIDSSLVAPEDTPGVYTTLKGFADYVFGVSKSIKNDPSYPGVQIAFNGSTINVFDKPSSSGTVKNIAFTDLIGQPAWILAPSIAFKTYMRADININDQVQMPKTLITNSAQAQTSLINQVAAQQGTFIISSIHHFGNFRQEDGYSWVTEFTAYPKNTTGQTS